MQFWDIFIPRYSATQAYVARRDSELWEPLISGGHITGKSVGKSNRTVSSSASDAVVDLAADSKVATSAASQLPPIEVLLQDGDTEILRCEIEQLTAGIKEGKWTSTRIVHAFIRSARRAQLSVNCLTEGESRCYPLVVA